MRDVAFIGLFTLFSLLCAKNTSAQNEELNPYVIDSSKITLWVSVMNGCVVSPVNYMEFKFYPDSTAIKFCPSLENSMRGGEDEMKFVVVPVNLWNRIQKYRESLEREGRRIDYRNIPQYRIEFDWGMHNYEYKITPEEHLILSDWFDEFSTR
jgi:hypothetical protein